jgi:hypothetical protein
VALNLLFASPANSNTARVFFSAEPKHISPLGADDVLLRDNWTISLVSGPDGVTEPVVELVENVVARTDVAAGVWGVDVRMDRPLIQRAEYLIIGGAAISSADGAFTLSPNPDDRDQFEGCSKMPVRGQKKPAEIDPRLDFYYDTFAGVYRLSSGNDYQTHGGRDALWKRIIRRIISAPSGFYHLEDYGAGVKVKGPFDPTRVGKLRLDILEQVRREEEVLAAKVDVRSDAQVLFINVVAKAREEDVAVGLEISDGEISVSLS